LETQINTIAAKEIDGYIEKGAIIIDLRDQSAYNRCHISNSINIPYDNIDYQDFRKYKCEEIVIYCDRGAVSLIAAKELTRRGYDVKTVIGGILAYRGNHLQKY